MGRPLEDELGRARDALARGFPEEAADRLDQALRQSPDAPEDLRAAARAERDRAQLALRRPARAVPAPTPAALAARRRAMIAVVVVSALTAITGLVAAVVIGLTT